MNDNSDDSQYVVRPYEEAEREILVKALKHFKGNITKASKSLKISRNTLYNKINKYEMTI